MTVNSDRVWRREVGLVDRYQRRVECLPMEEVIDARFMEMNVRRWWSVVVTLYVACME